MDTFIAVGELALFAALADRWSARSRASAWVVTLAGLAVSVAGNVGHVPAHSLTSRATAAIPPLAAAVALAVGLGVLKRVVQAHAENTAPAVPVSTSRVHAGGKAGETGEALPVIPRGTGGNRSRTRSRDRSRERGQAAPVSGEDAEREFMTELASGAVPSIRQVRSRMHVGQPRALRLRDHLERVVSTSANGSRHEAT